MLDSVERPRFYRRGRLDAATTFCTYDRPKGCLIPTPCAASSAGPEVREPWPENGDGADPRRIGAGSVPAR